MAKAGASRCRLHHLNGLSAENVLGASPVGARVRSIRGGPALKNGRPGSSHAYQLASATQDPRRPSHYPQDSTPSDSSGATRNLKPYHEFAWTVKGRQGTIPKIRISSGCQLGTCLLLPSPFAPSFPRKGRRNLGALSRKVSSPVDRALDDPKLSPRSGHGGRSLLPVSRTRVGVSDRRAQLLTSIAVGRGRSPTVRA